MRTILLLAGLLTALFAQPLFSQKNYTPDWASIDARPAPQWWLDAKFGIFIHWGMYAVPGYTLKGNYAEWYQYNLETNGHGGKIADYQRKKFGDRSYYDLADDFKAQLYDPEEWAKLFERSGAKYVVLTSKHHDGYCLWPNAQASKTWGFPWNSMERGPRRDLLGELFAALRKTSVKPGMYFSLYEWFNPLWKADPARYAREHAMPQAQELLEKYRPFVFWTDGDWDAPAETWQAQQFIAKAYNEGPLRDSIVFNDRWGSGVRFHHGGIYTPEYQPDLDFEDHAWEESRGMGFSYGYNRMEDAWDYNSAQSLVLHLVDKASRGGNFLLDVGPDEHGKIPPIMQERLLDMGRWLEANGEAIYRTRRWRTPVQWSAKGRRDWKAAELEGWKTGGDALLKQTVSPDPGYAVKEVFFTYNPATNALYATLPKWPAQRWVALRGLRVSPPSAVTLLATGQPLRFVQQGDNTVVSLPEYDPNRIAAPQAFVLKIAGYGAFLAKPKIEVRYGPQYMDNTVTITSPDPSATVRYTFDGTEPTPASPRYTKPLFFKNPHTLRAKCFKDKVLESTDVAAEVKVFTQMPALNLLQAPQPGLRMQTYSTAEKYTFEHLLRGEPQSSATAPRIELPPRCAAEKCCAVWTGYLDVPATGGYQFWLESDDGSTLSIDSQVLVDNDGDHGMTEKTGLAYLQKGWHGFRLAYFNSDGAGGLKVRWAAVGAEPKELAAEALGH
jgi:alpha-L-fucosidase